MFSEIRNEFFSCSSNKQTVMTKHNTASVESFTKVLKTLLKGGEWNTELKEQALKTLEEMQYNLVRHPNKVAQEVYNTCSVLKDEQGRSFVDISNEDRNMLVELLEGDLGNLREGLPEHLDYWHLDSTTGDIVSCAPLEVANELARIKKDKYLSANLRGDVGSIIDDVIETNDLISHFLNQIQGITIPDNAQELYRGEGGGIVTVDNKAADGKFQVSGTTYTHPETVSLNQCAAARTHEECISRRTKTNEQACLPVPSTLRHLNPDFGDDTDSAEKWNAIKTSHCVDVRAVPFQLRRATKADAQAIREGNTFKTGRDSKIYRKGYEPTSADIVVVPPSVPDSGNAQASNAVQAMYKAQYKSLAYNHPLHPRGFLVPVFFDENGKSTAKGRPFDPKMLVGDTYGEVQRQGATSIQRAFRAAARKKAFPTRLKEKLEAAENYNRTIEKRMREKVSDEDWYKTDNRYVGDKNGRIVWEDKYLKTEKGKKDETFRAKNEILARMVYEMATDLTDEEVGFVLKMDQYDGEKPLIIFDSQQCKETKIKELHMAGVLKKAQDQGVDAFKSKETLEAFLSEGVTLEGAEQVLGKEEMLLATEPVALTDLPASSTQDMIMVTSHGGNAAAYADRRWGVALEGGEQTSDGRQNKGSLTMPKSTIGPKKGWGLNELDLGVEPETTSGNQCLWRIGLMFIMLLRGAAKKGKKSYLKMMETIKRVLAKDAEALAPNSSSGGDTATEEKALLNILQSMQPYEQAVLEMMLFPQIANTFETRQAAVETMYNYSASMLQRIPATSGGSLSADDKQANGELKDPTSKFYQSNFALTKRLKAKQTYYKAYVSSHLPNFFLENDFQGLMRTEVQSDGGSTLRALFDKRVKAINAYNKQIDNNRTKLADFFKTQMEGEQKKEQEGADKQAYDEAGMLGKFWKNIKSGASTTTNAAFNAISATLSTTAKAVGAVARAPVTIASASKNMAWAVIGMGNDLYQGDKWGAQMKEWKMETDFEAQKEAREAMETAERDYQEHWETLTAFKFELPTIDDSIKQGLSEKEQRAVQRAMYVFGVTPYLPTDDKKNSEFNSIGYKSNEQDVTELEASDWTGIFQSSTNNQFIRDPSMNPTQFRTSVQNKKLPENEKQKTTMLNILRALQASRRVIQRKYQNDTEVRAWYQTLGSLTTQLPTN